MRPEELFEMGVEIQHPQEGQTWVVEVVRQEKFPNGNPFNVIRPIKRVLSEKEAELERRKQEYEARFWTAYALNHKLGFPTRSGRDYSVPFSTVWVNYEKTNPFDLDTTRADMLAAIYQSRPYGARSFSLLSEQQFDKTKEGKAYRYVRIMVAYFVDAQTGDFQIPEEELERFEGVTGKAVELAESAPDKDRVPPDLLQEILNCYPEPGTVVHSGAVNCLNNCIRHLDNGNNPPIRVVFHAQNPDKYKPPYVRPRHVKAGEIELSIKIYSGIIGDIGKSIRIKPADNVLEAVESLNRSLSCNHKFVYGSASLNDMPYDDRDQKWMARSYVFHRCEHCGAVLANSWD